jgi:hypothetical protein
MMLGGVDIGVGERKTNADAFGYTGDDVGGHFFSKIRSRGLKKGGLGVKIRFDGIASWWKCDVVRSKSILRYGLGVWVMEFLYMDLGISLQHTLYEEGQEASPHVSM